MSMNTQVLCQFVARRSCKSSLVGSHLVVLDFNRFGPIWTINWCALRRICSLFFPFEDWSSGRAAERSLVQALLSSSTSSGSTRTTSPSPSLPNYMPFNNQIASLVLAKDPHSCYHHLLHAEVPSNGFGNELGRRWVQQESPPYPKTSIRFPATKYVSITFSIILSHVALFNYSMYVSASVFEAADFRSSYGCNFRHSLTAEQPHRSFYTQYTHFNAHEARQKTRRSHPRTFWLESMEACKFSFPWSQTLVRVHTSSLGSNKDYDPL